MGERVRVVKAIDLDPTCRGGGSGGQPRWGQWGTAAKRGGGGGWHHRLDIVLGERGEELLRPQPAQEGCQTLVRRATITAATAQRGRG